MSSPRYFSSSTALVIAGGPESSWYVAYHCRTQWYYQFPLFFGIIHCGLAILDFIDENRTIIKHRLYRNHCWKAAPRVYIKDLRIISDRDMKDIVIVDNSVVSFIFNMDNGVPIADFRGQSNDEELMFMVSYLEDLF